MGKIIAGRRYTVVEGDSLSLIAGKLWTDNVYWANQATIGTDPNHIEPGQVIRIPGQHGLGLRIEVEAGDTLTGITEAWMWPWLYTFNQDVVGVDPNVITPGQVLTVPNIIWVV